MMVHFNVTGSLIWLDENGETEGTFDVHDLKRAIRPAQNLSGSSSSKLSRSAGTTKATGTSSRACRALNRRARLSGRLLPSVSLRAS
jgi:hypothetical protein